MKYWILRLNDYSYNIVIQTRVPDINFLKYKTINEVNNTFREQKIKTSLGMIIFACSGKNRKKLSASKSGILKIIRKEDPFILQCKTGSFEDYTKNMIVCESKRLRKRDIISELDLKLNKICINQGLDDEDFDRYSLEFIANLIWLVNNGI